MLEEYSQREALVSIVEKTYAFHLIYKLLDEVLNVNKRSILSLNTTFSSNVDIKQWGTAWNCKRGKWIRLSRFGKFILGFFDVFCSIDNSLWTVALTRIVKQV